jgi:hypothetical protein
MKRNNDPMQEGHTREWADRARVEMDPKEDVKTNASPKQSPGSEEEDVEEKSKNLKAEEKGDPFY